MLRDKEITNQKGNEFQIEPSKTNVK